MTALTHAVSESLQLSMGYARQLLKDVPADKFARFATAGGMTIVSNHPAFIYGHLSLYGARIAEQLNAAGHRLPDGYVELFSKEATCVDDPEGNIYPPMAELTEHCFAAYEAAAKAISTATGELYAQPNPGSGPMVKRFPTLGSMHNFYVGGHFMMHMGQMSAWRRTMGLGPAK